MKPIFIALAMTCLFSPNLQANDYRGQETREIKSLSVQDIKSIQEGKGWGMAKPAELNGYPGPRHVLDMAEELALSPAQRSEMARLFAAMQNRAIAVGKRYLETERQLEQVFRKKNVDQGSLKALIDASAAARAYLRYVHLSSHLKAINLLSRNQIATYNQLRGYGGDAVQRHSH